MDSKIQDKNQDKTTKELEEMYRAGFHFGYSRSTSHPKMKPYFFGVRNNTEIFNLEQIYPRLNEALEFLKSLKEKGSRFLIVATKPEARDLAERLAREINMPFVTARWLGGTLTNFVSIKKRIDYFKDLREKKKAGQLGQMGQSRLTKKEILKKEKELEKMEVYLTGLEFLSDKPAALLVIDPKKEKVAVDEAKKTGLPVVAFLNSDCDPSSVEYPVPGNDSSMASIQYFLNKVAEVSKI